MEKVAEVVARSIGQRVEGAKVDLCATNLLQISVLFLVNFEVLKLTTRRIWMRDVAVMLSDGICSLNPAPIFIIRLGILLRSRTDTECCNEEGNKTEFQDHDSL